jgi:excisionase family DNA binding protein
VDSTTPVGSDGFTLSDVADRFLTVDDLAEELSVSRSQAYALVRHGGLPAMKIGGRGQWRIERARLEDWINATHDQTARFVQGNPFNQTEEETDEDAVDG